MTDRTLTVSARPHPVGPHLLTVAGELDHHTGHRLRDALDEIPFESGAGLVIDLSDLSYCDSTGITLLVSAYQRAQSTSSPLSLAGLSPDLLRVFRIVGLDQVFTLEPSVEHAISALRP